MRLPTPDQIAADPSLVGPALQIPDLTYAERFYLATFAAVVSPGKAADSNFMAWLRGMAAPLSQAEGAATDIATEILERDEDFSGGTPGFVNSTKRFILKMGPNTQDFGWCLLAILDSTGHGENVAGYNQAHRRGGGPVWAGVDEVRDHTGGQSTAGVIAREIDVMANGPDPLLNRGAVDIVVGRDDPAGADMELGFALRVQAKAGDEGHVSIPRIIIAPEGSMVFTSPDGQAGLRLDPGGGVSIIAHGKVVQSW